jgi:hypothetical protein
MDRRNFIRLSTAGLAGFGASGTQITYTREKHTNVNSGLNLAGTAASSTARDKFWIWGTDAGVLNGRWQLPGNSRMTPVEGAFYMGIPNIIMVRFEGKPQPPFFQFAIPFKPIKRVLWSITGASGITSREERNQVFALAERMPNIVGFQMDDFFQGNDKAALSLDELRDVRKSLNIGGRKLDLCVTLYTHQLFPAFKEHLALCDIVSLWTWKAEDLKNLENNFATMKKLAPYSSVLLGCYMWDFGVSKPISIDWMKKQCEIGYRWLKEGQIAGMIFLATPLCDLELETVEWSRGWIAEVGEEKI